MDINITLTIQLAPALEKLIGAALGAAPTSPAPTREKTAEEVAAVVRPTETASAPIAEAGQVTSASATPAAGDTQAPKGRGRKGSAAEPATGSPAAPATDPFAPKPAAAAPVEAQPSTPTASSAEPAADVTLPMVQAAMSSWLNTAGNTALGLKTLFETNFKKADGSPAAKLSDLQPSDYAAVIAKLS